jgi:hypothetical protein
MMTRDGSKQITTIVTKSNITSNKAINQECIWDLQARISPMEQQRTAGNSYDNKPI